MNMIRMLCGVVVIGIATSGRVSTFSREEPALTREELVMKDKARSNRPVSRRRRFSGPACLRCG